MLLPTWDKLRVTLHHNRGAGVGQRSPRVRYGQVHVYNNLYRIGQDDGYQYSWGVGFRSAIYAEQNFFQVDLEIAADQVIDRLNGAALHEHGNLFDGPADRFLVDSVAAYNAANDPDLTEDVGWTPTLFLEIHRCPARAPARARTRGSICLATTLTW